MEADSVQVVLAFTKVGQERGKAQIAGAETVYKTVHSNSHHTL